MLRRVIDGGKGRLDTIRETAGQKEIEILKVAEVKKDFNPHRDVTVKDRKTK